MAFFDRKTDPLWNRSTTLDARGRDRDWRIATTYFRLIEQIERITSELAICTARNAKSAAQIN
jgi:hypothetical protein